MGDRYVLEALDGGGCRSAASSRGHVIFRDLATTGDGLLTGLCSARRRRAGRGGRSADLAEASMTRLPQVLRQRAGRPCRDPDDRGTIAADDRRGRGRGSATEGRVLVRPSGTEPLVRVMVEAPTAGRGRGGGRRSSWWRSRARGRGDEPTRA